MFREIYQLGLRFWMTLCCCSQWENSISTGDILAIFSILWDIVTVVSVNSEFFFENKQEGTKGFNTLHILNVQKQLTWLWEDSIDLSTFVRWILFFWDLFSCFKANRCYEINSLFFVISSPKLEFFSTKHLLINLTGT